MTVDLSAERVDVVLNSIFDRYPKARLNTGVVVSFALREMGVTFLQDDEARLLITERLNRDDSGFVLHRGMGGGWERCLVDPTYQAIIEKRNKRIEKNRSKVL